MMMVEGGASETDHYIVVMEKEDGHTYGRWAEDPKQRPFVSRSRCPFACLASLFFLVEIPSFFGFIIGKLGVDACMCLYGLSLEDFEILRYHTEFSLIVVSLTQVVIRCFTLTHETL